MRRIATALCATGALLALLAPGTASAAFGPVTSFDGSGAQSAQFNHPQSAAVGGTKVYVADTGNSRVAVYSPTGTFQSMLGNPPSSPQDVAVNGSTVAAVGSGQLARWTLLGLPLPAISVPATSYGVAIDGSGGFYVSDTQAGVINRYNSLGQLQGPIGSGQLSQPRGLTTDAAGSIYVADTGNSRIVKFDAAGAIQGVWTMPNYTIVANGSTITGQMQPRDVAVDGSGRVFAPDAGTQSNLVAVFSPNSTLPNDPPQEVFGSPISDPGNACAVKSPWGLAVTGTALYVVSTGENKIRVFDDNAPTGCPAVNFGSGGGINPGGGGGGKGGTAGAVSDRTPPTISFSGLPGKRCVRKNFTLTIHARDDVLLRKLTLYVNRRRVDSQLIYQQYWDVKVKIPVRKVRSALPRGAKFRVLIGVRVIDQSGKQSRVERAFKICG
jgi:hypothetical protein